MNEERDPRNAFGDGLSEYFGRPRGMDLWSRPGTKVIVANPEAGYDSDRNKVRRHLHVWGEYTVDHTEVGDCHTDVYLVEVSGINFNSVHFIAASDLPKEQTTK